MSACEIAVDATPAALNITATIQRGVNLIIGNKHSHRGNLRHIGSILTPQQVKVFQPVPDLVRLVKVKTHDVPIFLICFKKNGILCGKAFPKRRVFQILRQTSRTIGEIVIAIVSQGREDVLFLCRIAQIPTKIPEHLGELHSLVSLGFRKLHIRGISAVLHELTNTLSGILPGNYLCCFCISCGTTFCKMNPVLSIPNGELATL